MPSEKREAADPGLERIGAPSLAKRTREAVLQAIRNGRFADGRLPPENELAAALGVSRTTVRAALLTLEQDGILSRRRGIGTRVMAAGGPAQLELNRLAALDDLLRERGHEPSTSIVGVERIVAPEVADRLGYPPETEWHAIEKLWFADGEPAALLRDYVPCTLIPELPESSDVIGTIFRLFEEYGPEPIVIARVEIVPMTANRDIAQQLQIDKREPYLRLWQRHFGADRGAMAISRLDVNDHFIRFEMTRRI